VAIDEIEEDGPGVVVVVIVDVPICGDDDKSQEHDSEGVSRDAVPDAQRSWNDSEVLIRDSELNLERPSLRKANLNMPGKYMLDFLTLEEAGGFTTQLLTRRRRSRQSCKNPNRRGILCARGLW
jgi:hypothetical protein